MPEGGPLTLTVSPRFGKPQRLVVAKRGKMSHRDRIDTDSSISRNRFVKELAQRLGVDVEVLGSLICPKITALADQVDEMAKDPAGGGDDKNRNQATVATNMATDWDLWHTPANDSYVTLPVGKHLETWQGRSKKFTILFPTPETR